MAKSAMLMKSETRCKNRDDPESIMKLYAALLMLTVNRALKFKNQ